MRNIPWKITFQSVFSAPKARQGDRKTRTTMYWTEGIPTAFTELKWKALHSKEWTAKAIQKPSYTLTDTYCPKWGNTGVSAEFLVIVSRITSAKGGDAKGWWSHTECTALSSLELVSPGTGEADVQSQQGSSGCQCLIYFAAKHGSAPQCHLFNSFLMKKTTLCISKAVVLVWNDYILH